MRKWLAFPILLACIGCWFSAAAQDFNSGNRIPPNDSLVVSSAVAWTDSRLEVMPGDVVRVEATTTAGDCLPEGNKNWSSDGLVLTGIPPGALIGRIGLQAPFGIGAAKDLKVEQGGRLWLGMNAANGALCDGEIGVTLSAMDGVAPTAQAAADEAGTAAAAPASGVKSKLAAAAQTWLSGQLGTGATPAVTSNAAASAASGQTAVAASATPGAAKLASPGEVLDAKLGKELEALPRRVNDQFKNLGDMVNFVIVGSQEQLQSALAASSWHVADTTKVGAAVNAILQTYEKQDYLQMPMSTLYLFGRAQDYGYEQAEPYAVVASRHHFRVWKAPFTWNGQVVWVGAGTHDVGFEKDQRNGRVTHKIDPLVDGERDHIGETLAKSGKAAKLYYYLPPNPVQEASNATGGTYRSDGRLLVVFLQ